MLEVDTRLRATRAALEEFLTLAEARADAWDVALRPGKWSPSQMIEHLALTFEESASVVEGRASKFPTLPRIVRPVLRRFILRRVNRSGRLPNSTTPAGFDPVTTPTTPLAGRRRLDSAFLAFERACRESARRDLAVDSTVFGRIAVGEFVRFQEVHTRHHASQLGRAS